MTRLLKIENIKLPPGASTDGLTAETARLLRVRAADILSLRILRRSVDAREDPALVYTVEASVRDEAAVLKRRRGKRINLSVPKPAYIPPAPRPAPKMPPVVAGAGPAGLFCALVLAQAGLRPILLERGRGVEARQTDVERFWSTGQLDLTSNVQFGEGGAGAFSELLRLGADIRFETRLADLDIRQGRLAGIAAEGPAGAYSLPCSRLALCPGHSARDTFAMLHARGLSMEAKPFAVGVRVEHRQADCDAAQYKRYAGHPGLPASSYKLFCHLSGGRSVFSFCVCPGGEVVAAASEERQVVTNGMSEFARSRANINGALLVNVTPEDFGGNSPLAGIEFQRRLERAAYDLGGGGYRAPAQRIEDFLAGRPSAGPGRVIPSYRPGVVWTDLRQCLPPFVSDAIAEALPILGRKLRGYDAPDAVLTAVESRSSSPVRIPRDETCQSSLPGLYPCGEGAGYAGGILSAAADGMRCAEQICESL